MAGQRELSVDPVPGLFVIGAHKAGTTTLCALLDEHPGVAVSRPKEPVVLTRDRPAERVAARYREVFAHAGPGDLLVEGTTNYSQRARYPGVPERIAALSPGARLVYLVRDPVERIASAWVQYRSERRADVPADFAEAVEQVPELVDASRYGAQLQAYRDVFPAEQLLVLRFDELTADPVGVARRVFAFAGLDPSVAPAGAGEVHNPSAGKRQEAEALKRLRRVDALARLNRLARRSAVLSRAKAAVRDRALREIPPPAWTPELLAHVRADLAEDRRRHAELLAGLPDAWYR